MVQGNRQDRKPAVTIAMALAMGAVLTGAVTVGAFVGEVCAQTPASSGTGDFPDVNRVPQQSPAPPSAEDMRNLTQGLVPDSSGATYSGQGATGGENAKARYGRAGGTTRVRTTDIREPATGTGSDVTTTRATTDSPSSGASEKTSTVTTTAVTSQPIPAPPPVESERPVVSESSPVQAPAPLPVGAAVGFQIPQASQMPVGVLVDSNGERAVNAEAVSFLTVSPSAFQPEFVPTESNLVGEIYFGSSSSSLTGRDLSILQEIASFQRANGGNLRVVGHASSRTGDMSIAQHYLTNLQASTARAEAVRRALVRLGVSPEVVLSSAVSDNEPLFMEVMPSGEAFNRRVEVFLEY